MNINAALPSYQAAMGQNTPVVWGCNSNDEIFVRPGGHGGKWQQTDGRLRYLAVGHNGSALWGCNSNDDIYVRIGITSANPAGTSWQQVDGKLRTVGVCDFAVWGTNSNHDIYLRTGVSPHNLTGNAWKQVDGKLTQLAVGPQGEVWGVNAQQQIFMRTGVSAANPAGNGWQQVDGAAVAVAVGSNAVYVVNAAHEIFSRSNVSHANPAGSNWEQLDGRLKHIAASHDGQPWGVNASDDIFTRPGASGASPRSGNWSQLDGKLKVISAGFLSTGSPISQPPMPMPMPMPAPMPAPMPMPAPQFPVMPQPGYGVAHGVANYHGARPVPNGVIWGNAINQQNIPALLLQNPAIFYLLPGEGVQYYYFQRHNAGGQAEVPASRWRFCLVITNQRFIKIDNGLLVTNIPLSNVLRVEHQANGVFAHDKIVCFLRSGGSDGTGTYFGEVAVFFCHALQGALRGYLQQQVYPAGAIAPPPVMVQQPVVVQQPIVVAPPVVVRPNVGAAVAGALVAGAVLGALGSGGGHDHHHHHHRHGRRH